MAAEAKGHWAAPAGARSRPDVVELILGVDVDNKLAVVVRIDERIDRGNRRQAAIAFRIVAQIPAIDGRQILVVRVEAAMRQLVDEGPESPADRLPAAPKALDAAEEGSVANFLGSASSIQPLKLLTRPDDRIAAPAAIRLSSVADPCGSCA
jgi:hypothetical protein